MSLHINARTVLATLLFSFGGVVCAWLLFGLIQAVVQSREAAAWPTTNGLVESASVATGCGRGSGSYPLVRYSYSVAGVQYTSSRVGFGTACGSWDDAMSVVRHYKAGQEVAVSWNPQQPAESVLKVHEVLPGTWFAMGLCAAAVVCCFALVVYYLRGEGAA